MDAYFLTGADFGFFADTISSWLAYGVGLGAVAWILGQVVGLIYSFLRY